MNEKLARKLKEAGFKHDWCRDDFPCWHGSPDMSKCWPTLTELIEACIASYAGENPNDFVLNGFNGQWNCGIGNPHDVVMLNESFPEYSADGATPTEAVANLWLSLLEHPVK